MSLIIVKEIGYGLSGDTLDITIAIPKDSYLKSFWVGNQEDAKKADCTALHIGIDYIKAVQNTFPDGVSEQYAFQQMFTKLCETTDNASDNVYDVYQIKSDFMWFWDETHKGVQGIKVSQRDLNLITMELEAVVTEDFEYSTECGEDTGVLTVPLYNLMPIRLKVLDESKFLADRCEMPRSFIDKLLQLRTVELAICCNDFCKAMFYWDKFFGKEPAKEFKKCGCHGGGI